MLQGGPIPILLFFHDLVTKIDAKCNDLYDSRLWGHFGGICDERLGVNGNKLLPLILKV